MTPEPSAQEDCSARWVDARLRSSRHVAAPAIIGDISNSSCKIQTGANLAIGELIEIMVPRLGSMRANVRWKKGKQFGADFIAGSDSWAVPDPAADPGHAPPSSESA